ncbi:hypothetical protein BO79DRAFT_3148 [Aspergillus costaricaensis CBS 115574]|uniref:Uncharacterized protein n=1 Tax=Aspergillus costaricaensis CBS 115574 TaxID=1448317 RepID=A0ACD1IV66_9EURO|nr:hypothetical protein BO79DRAFT_3148 [Aspergillus costaricaensis CBS 115574]RAK94450.1 hypothetical protein BO79DRAFT_3148 [Aspergillus costaricaensis CBS 115574]
MLQRQPHHVAVSTVACFASNVPLEVSHLNVDRLVAQSSDFCCISTCDLVVFR